MVKATTPQKKQPQTHSMLSVCNLGISKDGTFDRFAKSGGSRFTPALYGENNYNI